MAEERKRRRGRRRGRPESPEPAGAEEPQRPSEEQPQISEESDAPGVLGSRLRFRLPGRGGGGERAGKERPPRRERPSAAGAAGDVSPMDFWRAGRARTHRDRPLPRQAGPAGLWRRITSLYFPPWVPVVLIIVVVFGILGLLFFTRSATGAPRINDHWHAPYSYIVCGQRQPNFPTWEGVGVHTHADGVIHIHPFTPSEEGGGARLIKWFEYGGGKLTADEVQAPGSSKTYHNGDLCPDGRPGQVQVFVSGAKLDDLRRYIPHDGDVVRIVFGPPEEVSQLEDRTIIAPEQATRTIDLTVTDDGSEASARFDPASIEVSQDEIVKIVIKNTGKISHGFRVQGSDGQYVTKDDFVSDPDIVQPNQEASAIVRLDRPGNVEFRDETLNQITGTIVVREAQAVTPTPSTAPQEPVDVTLDVALIDNAFQPASLTLPSGKKFRINLVNSGTFIHNLRIAGPDGQYRTADDIISKDDVDPGGTGEVVGQIDTPGTYTFRDDFHPAEMAGTITVQ